MAEYTSRSWAARNLASMIASNARAGTESGGFLLSLAQRIKLLCRTGVGSGGDHALLVLDRKDLPQKSARN